MALRFWMEILSLTTVFLQICTWVIFFIPHCLVIVEKHSVCLKCRFHCFHIKLLGLAAILVHYQALSVYKLQHVQQVHLV